MSQNFIAVDREQAFLLPPDVRDWLPEGHLAWFVLDAVAEMVPDHAGGRDRIRPAGAGEATRAAGDRPEVRGLDRASDFGAVNAPVAVKSANSLSPFAATSSRKRVPWKQSGSTARICWSARRARRWPPCSVSAAASAGPAGIRPASESPSPG